MAGTGQLLWRFFINYKESTDPGFELNGSKNVLCWWRKQKFIVLSTVIQSRSYITFMENISQLQFYQWDLVFHSLQGVSILKTWKPKKLAQVLSGSKFDAINIFSAPGYLYHVICYSTYPWISAQKWLVPEIFKLPLTSWILYQFVGKIPQNKIYIIITLEINYN